MTQRALDLRPRTRPSSIYALEPAMLLPADMLIFKTFALFVLTAIAEIMGCYLPYLWLRGHGSTWLLVPAALSLAGFAWLLTLHPAAAGRVYAAYGGVYVAVALVWLWRVEGVQLTRWDLSGAAVALTGMGIIVWGGWHG